MKQLYFKKHFLCFVCLIKISTVSISQNFPEGTSTICSTTTATLPETTAADGIKITPYLWLNASCLDADLAVFSLNSPAQFRKPTFCYDNQYFPSGANRPLAVKTNTTTNAGGCYGARATTNIDFITNADFKPKGVSFTICDIDNPYDTIQVMVYSAGTLVNYTFEFADPDPASSFAWACTNFIGNSGTNTTFNGGANGVWGESSASVDWAKGAIYFTVDPDASVDSIVVSNIVRNNRPDLNPAWSIGNIKWTSKVPVSTMPVSLTSFTAQMQFDKTALLKWTTVSEQNCKGFYIEYSEDGRTWSTVGFVASKSINGNSDKVLHYDYTDGKLLQNYNYYRIKQIDIDYTISYSSVISLRTTKNEKNNIIIYPNPTVNTATVSGLKGNEKISIKNSQGQTVKIAVAKTTAVVLELSGLGNGLYYIAITNDDGTVTLQKLVVAGR